uniref:hypothetical protein n=1 Tax=Nonomuraea sp. CA-251285 TaxID=3240002 RepID=UPI003F49AAEC
MKNGIIRTPLGKSTAMYQFLPALEPGTTRVGHYTGGTPGGRAAQDLIDLVNEIGGDRRWLIFGGQADKNILSKVEWGATTAAGALDMLRAAVDIINKRKALSGAAGCHLLTLHLCFDEAAALFTAPDMLGDDARPLLHQLLTQGPSHSVRPSFRSTEDRRLIEEYAEIDTETEPST